MPLGSAPLPVMSGTGKPLAVTAKFTGVPTVIVIVLPLVNAGTSFTVSVKFCVTPGPTPLLAPTTSGYTPPVPALGVPASTPVAGVKPRRPGSAPVIDSVGAGTPVAVTVKVP